MLINAIPMLLLVAANVLYHLSMKGTPSKANAMATLAVCYFVALVLSLALLPFFGGAREGLASFRYVGWQSFTLGLGVVGIEVGFLLAYRAGGSIGMTALFANVLLTLVLVPIGMMALGERFTVQNGVGIVLAIAGLALMSAK